MDLNPGDKLGPYEIVSAMGKSGMGPRWTGPVVRPPLKIHEGKE
jgi:hypothetical protein